MADFDAPGRYVRANYEREDWLAVVLIYRNPALVKQEFATAERISKPSYQAHLRAANASGADVYLTVNALKPGATGRTKADVETVRHVYLDLDGGGREAVDRILQAPRMPAPHHILNTSPGKYQLIWSVAEFDKDQAEDLVRGLAARHGADQAVWDVARVLRIPGFRNHKYQTIRHFIEDLQDQPPLVRDYGARDFLEVLNPNGPGERSTRSFRPNPKTEGAGDSQSERDRFTPPLGTPGPVGYSDFKNRDLDRLVPDALGRHDSFCSWSILPFSGSFPCCRAARSLFVRSGFRR